MTKEINHLNPPSQFQYRERNVILNLKYDFVCDNRIYFTPTVHKDLLHHTYELEVHVQSPVNEMGLALDFNEVDAIFNQHVKTYLHQQLINETLPEMNTTSENIAMWIWDQFEAHLPEGNTLNQLELWETKDHSVILRKED